jgi:hypothetical protein
MVGLTEKWGMFPQRSTFLKPASAMILRAVWASFSRTGYVHVETRLMSTEVLL